MEKRHDKFFWIFNSKWQTTRKLIKSAKNVGGKSTHFCLGPKTWIGHWYTHFTLRSKIHVFGDTILQLVLILIANRNHVWKSLRLHVLATQNFYQSYLCNQAKVWIGLPQYVLPKERNFPVAGFINEWNAGVLLLPLNHLWASVLT